VVDDEELLGGSRFGGMRDSGRNNFMVGGLAAGACVGW
jgi:hypothetical protein